MPNDFNDAFNSIVAGLQDVKQSSDKTAQNYTVRRVLLMVVGVAAGLALLIFAVSSKIIILGVVGFALMLAGVLFGFRKGHSFSKTNKPTVKERYRAYIQDLEAKDRERFKSPYDE